MPTLCTHVTRYLLWILLMEWNGDFYTYPDIISQLSKLIFSGIISQHPIFVFYMYYLLILQLFIFIACSKGILALFNMKYKLCFLRLPASNNRISYIAHSVSYLCKKCISYELYFITQTYSTVIVFHRQNILLPWEFIRLLRYCDRSIEVVSKQSKRKGCQRRK